MKKCLFLGLTCKLKGFFKFVEQNYELAKLGDLHFVKYRHKYINISNISSEISEVRCVGRVKCTQT